MRYKEFNTLLEYKRDITISNFGDRIVDRMHNDNGLKDWIATRQPEDEELHNEFFQVAEEADPSQNKQYVQWIVQRFLDNSISRYEDISSNIAEFLFKYHNLKTRNRLNDPSDGAQAIPADINQIKTKEDINAVHTELTPRWNRLSQEQDNNREQKMLSKGKASEVYKDAYVRVIVPEDEASACYYGQGTMWCTASTMGQNYFDHYNSNGKLYILIPTKPEYEGEKYQLHFQNKQFMNEQDVSIPLGHLLDVRFAGSDVVEFFMKIEPSITKMIEFASESVLMDIVDVIVEYVKGEVLPPIIEKVEEENHVAYYDWLEEGGFLLKDKKNNIKVKDGAPHYLEFDEVAKDAIENILFNVDANYVEIMDAVEIDCADGDSYTLQDITSILRRKVDDIGDGEPYQWMYNEVGQALEGSMGIETSYYDTDKSFKLMNFDVYAYPTGDNQTGRGNGYRYGGKDYK
mgnify:FL=1